MLICRIQSMFPRASIQHRDSGSIRCHVRSGSPALLRTQMTVLFPIPTPYLIQGVHLEVEAKKERTC